jgi:hypothetical protein
VRFEALAAVRMMMMIWILTPCRFVGRDQRFGEKYCLHLAEIKMETVCFAETFVLPTNLHGVKTQNIITFKNVGDVEDQDANAMMIILFNRFFTYFGKQTREVTQFCSVS